MRKLHGDLLDEDADEVREPVDGRWMNLTMRNTIRRGYEKLGHLEILELWVLVLVDGSSRCFSSSWGHTGLVELLTLHLVEETSAAKELN